MREARKIHDAMRWLSCIGRTTFHYDPVSKVLGDGAIHYLVEVGELLLIVWENNDTGIMVVNPITRFDLEELRELGAEDAWTVLHVPAEFAEGIQFWEIDDAKLVAAYRAMEGQKMFADSDVPLCLCQSNQARK